MSLYEHYRQHEHPFVDQTLAWISEVEQSYAPLLTHFLDPREREIIKTILGKSHELVSIDFSGGAEQAERQRCLFYPYYEEIEADDFEINLLEGQFPEKFVKIEHRDILGSLMSLGIERKTIGDIYLYDNKFQIIVTDEMLEYIILNLTKIRNATIHLKEKTLSEIQFIEGEWETKDIIVASLRLDVIVKEVYRMPRAKAVKLIEQKRVKLNHQVVDQPSVNLQENDLLSVRGYGRSKLKLIGRKTRKDNIILNVNILKDN